MRDKIIYILGVVALILLARDIYLFTGFPPERNQGVIFKIIFFHVPMAITALTCAMVAFIASALFLITKQFKYDALAVAVTEVGLAFLAGNLITYAGYLMLRNAIEEPTQRATFAAVFSIFAFIDVPIVIFSIKWWRTQHPQPVIWGGGSFPPDWKAVFGWQMLAVMLIGVVFTMVRLRQEEFQREIDSLRRMAHAL